MTLLDVGTPRRRVTRNQSNTSFTLPDVKLNTPRDYKWKALCKQAEEEFLKTEYEKALVLYHRALKDRPHCKDAHNGIRRCTEALNTLLIEPVEKDLAISRCGTTKSSTRSRLSTRSRSRDARSQRTARTQRSYGAFSDWANELLGKGKQEVDPHDPTEDMRNDAEHVFTLRDNNSYMKAIYSQLVQSTALAGDDALKALLKREMKYAKTRGYFWRHQIPEPTAPKLFKQREHKPEQPVEEAVEEVKDYTVIAAQQLSQVMQAQQAGDYTEAIQQGRECLLILDMVSALEVDYKDDVYGTVYSIIGNCYFEMDDIQQSITWHQQDLTFGRKKFLDASISRALGNLGRSYAKIGNFKKAIELWSEKVGLCSEDGERAWLFHEMGYCHLTLGEFMEAHQCGITAYESAQNADSTEWQINACALIAQTEVAQGYLQSSLETYNQAVYLCEESGNEAMKAEMTSAMQEVQAFMAVQQSGEDPEAQLQLRAADRPVGQDILYGVNQPKPRSKSRGSIRSITSRVSNKATERQEIKWDLDDEEDQRKHTPTAKSPRPKQILKSHSQLSIDTKRKSKSRTGRFQSQSKVSFAPDVTGSFASLQNDSGENKNSNEVTDNRKDQDLKTSKEGRSVNYTFLPPIAHSPIVTQRQISDNSNPSNTSINVTDESSDQENQPPANFTETTENARESRLSSANNDYKRNMSSNSFYLNTSDLRSEIARVHSGESRGENRWRQV